nr:hypothetical protein [Tanacetum cinerariifolium]
SAARSRRGRRRPSTASWALAGTWRAGVAARGRGRARSPRTAATAAGLSCSDIPNMHCKSPHCSPT